MRSIEELLDTRDPALPFVVETVEAVPGRCVMHPPAATAADALYRCQVTTRSPMGAIVYHTGGITVLDGWLRILGSACPSIPRRLPEWNEGRSSGFYLVADDAFGGFFALDGGALGPGKGKVFYFSPRSLEWEGLDCTYSQFLVWACSDFRRFYDDMTWPGCESAIAGLGADRCLFFWPSLWTAECVLPPGEIRDVPVAEAWEFQMDVARQMRVGDGKD